MTTPMWTFPDPLEVVLAILRGDPSLAGITFGTLDPDPTTNGAPARPWGRLSVDYSYTTQRVRRTANLRLQVWAATPGDALAWTQKCWAVLLGYPGDASVSGISELTGPLPALDPGSKTPTVSTTYAARLRPVTL